MAEARTTQAARDRDHILREQVVTAARILAHEGYADLTVGHVSVCDRERRVMYIKRKGPALNELEPADVLVHTIDDDQSLRTVPDMHFEAVMHTGVYRARADVNSVIHSHPPYGTALGVTSEPVHMLAHDSIMFAEHGVPAYEEHQLITESGAGDAMAKALGSSRAMLLRGHGVLIVGEDVRWAVRAALTLERAIKIQSLASTLGELQPMSPEAAKEFFPRKYTAKAFVDRPGFADNPDKTSLDEFWDYWSRVVRRTDGLAPRQV